MDRTEANRQAAHHQRLSGRVIEVGSGMESVLRDAFNAGWDARPWANSSDSREECFLAWAKDVK